MEQQFELLSEDNNNVLANGSFGQIYPVKEIDETRISQMVDLQKLVGQEQTVFRSEEYLQGHFKRHSAIGVIGNDDRLLAMALIRNENINAEQLSSVFAAVTKSSAIWQSTLSCVQVAPDARKRGHMRSMLREWEKRAREDGCELLHTRVRIDNEDSLKNFEDLGLTIAATGPSPDYPYREVHTLYRALDTV